MTRSGPRSTAGAASHSLLPATRDITAAVCQRLEKIDGDHPDEAVRWWTRKVQSVVDSVLDLPREGFTRSGRLSGWDPEFLVDMAITRDEPGADRNDCLGYQQLCLAMESEWSAGRADREYDFTKLADIRAERKLFVGAARSRKDHSLECEVARLRGFWGRHRGVTVNEEVGLILIDYVTGCWHSWVIVKNGEGRSESVPVRPTSSPGSNCP